MTTGTYTLVVDLDAVAAIDVGALGTVRFDPGWYAYTGSAFGPGGLARVDRHRELAAGDRTVRHWHVDYLLGHPDADVRAAWITPDADRECEIAQRLPGDRIPEFGASDCDCGSHLAVSTDHSSLVTALEDLHARRDGDAA